jgi:predicted metal-dependent HD superfamily phosphohydrolase
VTVYVDPPAWPAHGTLFSHLVSDASLAELHSFADRIGLSRRAFDLDHYDVAAERYDDAVAAGAVPVGGRELARRLGASGLRVPGRARRAAKAQSLLARWDALLPGARDVGVDLIERWHEPHRVYHGPEHLVHALDSLALLEGRPGGVPDAGTQAPAGASPGASVTQLAVWFHDAVHDGEARVDEERSAALAVQALAPHLDAADVDEVARLVLLTADHSPAPDDVAGGLVSDADLAILAAAPDRYGRYARQVRAEYAHVPDDAFRAGRAGVLRSLLDAGPLYRTAFAAERWEERARANLSAELADLA